MSSCHPIHMMSCVCSRFGPVFGRVLTRTLVSGPDVFAVQLSDQNQNKMPKDKRPEEAQNKQETETGAEQTVQ